MKRILIGIAAALGIAGISGRAAAVNPGSTGVTVQISMPARITVRKIQAPASPVVSGPLTYNVVVTNTGITTITNLLVVDTVSPVLTGASFDQPGGIAVPVVASVPGAG